MCVYDVHEYFNGLMVCCGFFRCKKNCLENLGEDNCIDVFTRIYGISSKNEQDLYLQGLIIDVGEVNQRRPKKKKNPGVTNSASFSYNLIIGSSIIEVYMKALLSEFNVSEKLIHRIRKLKMESKVPEDKRGR